MISNQGLRRPSLDILSNLVMTFSLFKLVMQRKSYHQRKKESMGVVFIKVKRKKESKKRCEERQ
jgi:hypothetical protein